MKLLPILLVFLAACGSSNFEKPIETTEIKPENPKLINCPTEINENQESLLLTRNPLKGFGVYSELDFPEIYNSIEKWNDALEIDLLHFNEDYSVIIEKYPFSKIKNESFKKSVENKKAYSIIKNKNEDNEYCKIVIDSDKIYDISENKLTNLITHEIGHCLGLYHDLNNSAMNSEVPNDCIPNYLIDLIYERYNL